MSLFPHLLDEHSNTTFLIRVDIRNKLIHAHKMLKLFLEHSKYAININNHCYQCYDTFLIFIIILSVLNLFPNHDHQMGTLYHPEHLFPPLGNYAFPIGQSRFHSITIFLKSLAPLSLSNGVFEEKRRYLSAVKFITQLQCEYTNCFPTISSFVQ